MTWDTWIKLNVSGDQIDMISTCLHQKLHGEVGSRESRLNLSTEYEDGIA